MKKLLIYILFQSILLLSFSQLKVQNLLTESRSGPMGIDQQHPRFTWQLVSEKRNCRQTAYEVVVKTGKETVWNSGKVMSEQSVFIPYSGKELTSGTKYTWQVRVWDDAGNNSGWSNVTSFSTGLLSVSDWKAKWIEADFIEDSINRPPQYFRKQFSINKKISSATAYITAHGLYEAQINGKKVGNAYLTPGWTSYNNRLAYQVYDVKDLLSSGSNVIGVTAGNGWYRGFIAWRGNKDSYGKKIGLLVEVHITYTDGSSAYIISDGSWRSSTGSITFSEIYHGETIDARKEQKGWATVGFNDKDWHGVKEVSYPMNNLLASYNEPIKQHETFKPVKVFTTPKNEKVIDFGQNLVGWVKLKIKGRKGDKITINHAEVLDRYGNFYTDNLRAAKATSTYYLSGDGEEYFEPHFTFYGFRYIKVEGVAGALDPENFTAVALYSDLKPTGTFSSSNELINQLQHNIQWGQRGNFLDVPTDCPQRDERLGWTGDAQAFSRTAAFNFGVNDFFAKWLKDLAADQLDDGRVPHVIPNVLGKNASAATGWADAATIIPWNMYLAYGDKKILEDQYASMKKWVGFMEAESKNDLWNTGSHYGDWLFYRPFDDNDGRSAVTDKYMIAQCFFSNSVQLMINTSKVLGKDDDVKKYTDLLKRLKAAFIKEYVTPNGRLVSSTQTAYVLALNFDMLPEDLRGQAVERLVENIKNYNNHLTTGFLGTPYLCHVLNRFGKTDLAYTLLMQETYPSWLYPVKMGATTIWERWNGMHPDSTFEPASMNSFNHYAYGAIGDWMYRVVAGIDTYENEPGYKHISIRPHIGGNLSNASASLKTYYGEVSSSWKTGNGKTTYDIEIPANTYATIELPAKSVNDLSGDFSKEQKVLSTDKGLVKFEIGSGKYQFVVKN